jgi:hypothetical protein
MEDNLAAVVAAVLRRESNMDIVVEPSLKARPAVAGRRV